MLMILDLLIYGGLIGIGATLWYGVERRTERLVAQERKQTERWRRAYYAHAMTGALADDGEWAPQPPLQMDSTDADNLMLFGRTARKRIRPQKAQGTA